MIGSRLLKSIQRRQRWLYLRLPWRVRVTMGFAFALLLAGTLGYRWIEGPEWTYFDGFYFTAITLTTIGYGETHTLSDEGRFFTVILAYSGVFTLAYFASELVRAVVSGELRDAIGRQRMEDQLGHLHQHLIVCGFGRMGRIVCGELDRQGRRFVMIDRQAPLLQYFEYKHGLPLIGDATEDEVLRKAGIDRARALITVVASDADNLYISLSARLLNATLFIVARAEEEAAGEKLKKVGVNNVISPYLAGGHRAVQAVLRPAVLHFMEMTTRPEFVDLSMEEVQVQPNSVLAGRTLSDAQLGENPGVIVIGLLPKGGELLYNPSASHVIEALDVLLVLGKKGQLEALERLAAPTG